MAEAYALPLLLLGIAGGWAAFPGNHRLFISRKTWR
jgi:hypothetical protein